VIVALAGGTMFALAVIPAPGTSRSDRLFAIAGAAIVYAAFGDWVRTQAPLLEEVWFRAIGHPWGAVPAVAPEWSGPILWVVAGVGLAAATVAALRPTGRTPVEGNASGGGLAVTDGGHPVAAPAFGAASRSAADA
jgi:hypothetical protein